MRQAQSLKVKKTPMDQARTVRQKTLKGLVRCRGIGLHSGAHVTMVLHPAGTDFGIRFRRTDDVAEIAATWRNLVPSQLCSTLATKRSSVSTIEHLMAAFAGLGLDNVLVELDGPEVPAMDGSAAPFVYLIERTGIVEQDAPRRAIKILKPVRVAAGEAAATLEPADAFSVSFAIDFAAGAIRRQTIAAEIDAATFKHDICRARTFGMLDEVAQLRAAGLALGGSLDNAVVVSGDRVLNEGGLRYGDEFVRHKVLDAIGDLYLAGGPILGHFEGQRSGHALNRELLCALFADPKSWRSVVLQDAMPAQPEMAQLATA
jgi:UDP-3-O-[3-hydroxymyristoyl] N-acetylglucosamine deacetylase